MPEDDKIKTHLTAIGQIYSSEISQRNEKITEQQKALAEKDARIEDLETRVAELQEIRRYAATLDLVTHPTILVCADNIIQFANEKILAVSHYDLSEMLHKSLTDFFQGIEFLDQIRLDPLLMQVEDLDMLSHVPVMLTPKDGNPVPSSAEINFLTPPRAYNGIKLALKPKEERTLLQKTRQRLPRYLGGISKYDGLDAVEYVKDHRLSTRDQSAEPNAPLDGTHLLTEITRRVLELDNPTYNRRRVLVSFRSIDTCDSRFYQTLLAISQMKGIPLACIVSEDSEPYRELLKIGFPEKNIVKERKKEKKK